jgi:hypothetical protein
MKNLLEKLSSSARKLDKRHIQIFLALVTLSLLVLGAGAPGVGSGGGGW